MTWGASIMAFFEWMFGHEQHKVPRITDEMRDVERRLLDVHKEIESRKPTTPEPSQG